MTHGLLRHPNRSLARCRGLIMICLTGCLLGCDDVPDLGRTPDTKGPFPVLRPISVPPTEATPNAAPSDADAALLARADRLRARADRLRKRRVQ